MSGEKVFRPRLTKSEVEVLCRVLEQWVEAYKYEGWEPDDRFIARRILARLQSRDRGRPYHVRLEGICMVCGREVYWLVEEKDKLMCISCSFEAS